jgi:hypothetical protein
MSMPHLYSGHEGVMSWDGWESDLEFGKNFWHAWQVVTSFDPSSMIEGQYKPCLNTFAARALMPI